MSADIMLRHPSDVATATGNLLLRHENTINAPITTATVKSSTYSTNGQPIADTYQLDFTKVGAAFSVDVTCGEGSKNPYQATGISITCDGVTANDNVVPGIDLVFNAGIVTGWQAKVSIGAYMTAVPAITDVLNIGVVQSGSNSTQQKIAAVNIGADNSVDTTVSALPGMYWTPNTATNIVMLIDNHTDDTREHTATAGTYTITFANWGDDAPSGKKKCDILVGGNTAVTTALFDGTTRYQYGVAAYDDANDYLQGLSIMLQDTTDDPSAVTVTLVVRDGDDWCEFAEDNAGSPGSFATGSLTLTETGEAAGTITAGNLAYFWFRWNVPDSASPAAIRCMRAGIRGKSV